MEEWHGVISNDYIVRPSIPYVPIPNESLPEFLWSRAMKHPANRTALTCGVTGRSYNFKDARALSKRFGAALLRRKLEPGDVLAIMMPNNPYILEFPLILLGSLEAGLLVTTLNSSLSKNEVIHHMQMTKPKVTLTVPAMVPLITEALAALSVKKPRIITIGHSEKPSGVGAELWDFHDMTSRNIQPEITVKVCPESIAMLPASSGTTGVSKIVARTHRLFVASLILSVAFPKAIENDSVQEVQIVALPLHSSFAQAIFFSGLINGDHLIALPFKEPQILIDFISRQKPLTVVLNYYPHMLVELNPLVKTKDLESIRALLCSGSPTMSSHYEEFLKKLPKRENVKSLNAYGMTEAPPPVWPIPNHPNPKAIGYPMLNTEIRIVDSSGNNLGPGQEGEMYIRGPQVMKGYYKNDEANGKAFDRDWFKTGDVAYFDEDGIFYLVGRIKDFIKVGPGLMVPPVELETVLLSHPCIADVSVFGVPDNLTGEMPVAFVVPKKGMEIDPDDAIEFVASQVASFKKLRAVIVTDSLPRNSSAKVLKYLLKEQYILRHSNLNQH